MLQPRRHSIGRWESTKRLRRSRSEHPENYTWGLFCTQLLSWPGLSVSLLKKARKKYSLHGFCRLCSVLQLISRCRVSHIRRGSSSLRVRTRGTPRAASRPLGTVLHLALCVARRQREIVVCGRGIRIQHRRLGTQSNGYGCCFQSADAGSMYSYVIPRDSEKHDVLLCF